MAKWTNGYELPPISKAELRAIVGDPHEAARRMRRFEKSSRWLENHAAELTAQHPKRWVAVYDCAVVGYARTLDALLRKIERAGLPRRGLAVEFLDPNPPLFVPALILPCLT